MSSVLLPVIGRFVSFAWVLRRPDSNSAQKFQKKNAGGQDDEDEAPAAPSRLVRTKNPT